MVNEVTAPTRKDKMASRTAATGLGMGGPSDPHEQPRKQTDRRESWCQEDVDALVNKAFESFEAANRTITALRVEISCLEHRGLRMRSVSEMSK